MKLRTTLALLALLATFVTTLAQAAPEDEIRAAGQKWIDGIGMGDPDYMVALYAEDGILHGTGSPVVRVGHALIREYFAGLNAPVKMDFVEPQHIRVFGDVAVNTGNYETSIDGGAPIRLRYSFVYHKVGDEWLIVDHHSSRMPEVQ
ncbi:MAG: SgcJ/EcaC family oxidoreductase [Gammaproteobacteria bacterium]